MKKYRLKKEDKLTGIEIVMIMIFIVLIGLAGKSDMLAGIH